jgi:hypothetical protein
VTPSCDIQCLRQSCDTTYDKLTTPLTTCALGIVAGKSSLTPLPAGRQGFWSVGNDPLFDNSSNYEGLRTDDRMEKGYEEGCTRGPIKSITGNPPKNSVFARSQNCAYLCAPHISKTPVTMLWALSLAMTCFGYQQYRRAEK